MIWGVGGVKTFCIFLGGKRLGLDFLCTRNATSHDFELVKCRLIWSVTWGRGELDARAERGMKVNINSKVMRIRGVPSHFLGAFHACEKASF
jgi:hypothetical protein